MNIIRLSWIIIYSITAQLTDTFSEGDCAPAKNVWMLPVFYMVLTLAFMLMEDKLGDHGTASERAPL